MVCRRFPDTGNVRRCRNVLVKTRSNEVETWTKPFHAR